MSLSDKSRLSGVFDPTDDASRAVLGVIRGGGGLTRQSVVRATRLSRSTVSERINDLLEVGLVREGTEAIASGGRPAASFHFNASAGVVLAADLGSEHSRLAITDLAGQVIEEHAEDMSIADGPEPVLEWLGTRFDQLLAHAGHQADRLWGIGVGLPGPVDFARGMAINPPIMPGWDRYPVAQRLGERFGVPVAVDNDVNVMAAGEHWAHWRDVQHMLVVKATAGIGSGIISSGKINRGVDGAAGDIGHLHMGGYDEVVCRCGNTGCLEAVAGGSAVVAQLRERGIEVADSRATARLANEGNVDAIQLIRRSGRLIGEALASAVNLLNPEIIVLGGDLAEVHEQLFAGVREVIYQRSLPLATRRLRIVSAKLGDRGGVVGAATMAIDHALSAAGATDSEPLPR